jgi:hypothetical protein
MSSLSANKSGVAKAASVETPTASTPQANAIPRAAATPIRIPVNDPGPTVTATRPIDANPPATRSISRWIIGINASAWPRSMGKLSEARTF